MKAFRLSMNRFLKSGTLCRSLGGEIVGCVLVIGKRKSGVRTILKHIPLFLYYE